MYRRYLICLAALFLSACGNSIVVPAAPIDKIHVWGGALRHELAVINDPTKIAGLETYLDARKSGWNSPVGTSPTAGYDLIFESGGKEKYMLWISLDSADWIGFRSFEDPGHELFRDITPAEHADLLKLAGIAKPP